MDSVVYRPQKSKPLGLRGEVDGLQTEAKDVLDRIHSWLTCNGFATVGTI